jgi:integrase
MAVYGEGIVKRYVLGCRFTQNGVRYIRFGRNKAIRLGTVAELPTRSHVERAARPYVDAYNSPKPTATLTMGQVIDKYRKEVMSKRASTAATEGSWIKNHIEPRWGKTLLAEFGRPVDAVQDWLKGLDLGTKSKREIKNILLRMVRSAGVWGWLESKPELGDIRIKRQKGERTRKARVLPLGEFKQMAGKLSEPYRTMSYLAYVHGLRVSELFGLQWRDVDWLGEQFQVCRSVVAQIEDDTKTQRSEAVLPLSDAEIEMLKAWRKVSDFTEPTDYIFASPYQAGEKPYSFTGFKQVLWRACDDAGIARITPHSFRHSLRNWLKNQGASAELTTEMMRHTNYNQSREYGNDGVSPKVREMHDRFVREVL